MKAIVLAAGYAKRLYPLTKNKAKPLLEVKGKPIVQHIMEKIKELPVSEVLVVTNAKFYKAFKEWAEASDSAVPIKIINDGTKSDKGKLGGIADIAFALQAENVNEDILVIAGDNLFNFTLKKMFEKFRERNAPYIGLYDVGWINEARKLGVVELDKSSKVIDFEEKPEQPASTLAATLIYMFPKNIVGLIDEYLKEGNSPDMPGYFIKWLHKKTTVYGFVFQKKWFDIGSLESLELARKEFKEKEENNGKPKVKEEEESFFGLKEARR